MLRMRSLHLLRSAAVLSSILLWLSPSATARAAEEGGPAVRQVRQAPWFEPLSGDTEARYFGRVENGMASYAELLQRQEVQGRPRLARALRRHLELLQHDLERGEFLRRDQASALVAQLERLLTLPPRDRAAPPKTSIELRPRRGDSTAVAGTVTDLTSGKPIDGAVVTASISLFILGSDVTDQSGGYFIPLAGLQVPVSLIAFEPNYLIRTEHDISIPPNTTRIVDFELQLGGSIEGRVTSARTGIAIPSAIVELYDDQLEYLGSSTVAIDGLWESPVALDTGNYLARTLSVYRDEAYNDVGCEPTCDLSLATPIAVQAGQRTEGIDFVLAASGHAITGRAVDALSGQPVSGSVYLYDSNGSQVSGTDLGAGGAYALETGFLLADPSKEAGWYVLIDPDLPYLPELFGGAACHLPCTATVGDLVITRPDITTEDVNVAVDAGLTMTGNLSWEFVFTLELPGLEIYDDAGTLVTNRVKVIGFSGLDIDWGVALEEGLYHVRTRSSNWQDQLYDGFVCEPECDVTQGTVIAVVPDPQPPPVNIDLRAYAIFYSGFEDGTLSDWSSSVP